MKKGNVVAMQGKVQRWAERIREAHGNSVAAIVEVGRQLLAAKAECTHGEWGELTGRATGETLLPFWDRTARRYMLIAKNNAMANGTHGSHLPASLRTLAILASLDPVDIEAAIADGDIHPDMQRKDAEALKLRLQAKPARQQAMPAADVTPITAPVISEAERAAWDEGLKEGGQMIAEFAERQAHREQVAAAFAQQPENQAAAAAYRDILAHLEAAESGLVKAHDLAYFDIAFWDAAMVRATRIVAQLEKLSCK